MVPKFSIIFVLSLVLTAAYGFPQGSSRIVGGRDALPGEFPYQVNLRTLEDRFFCGGFIIGPSWSVTAAHCVINQPQTGVRVVVGSIFLDAGGVAHQSSRIILHPQYDTTTLAYDVAVIQNQVPFVFNAFVAPISLSTANSGAGLTGVVAGWGGTGRTGPPMPNTMQTVNVVTLTNADCRSRHNAEDAARIFDQKICTYYLPAQGMCFGDSGGALVIGNSAVGIVSWGYDGCAGGRPDVFIRVSHMYDWIQEAIRS